MENTDALSTYVDMKTRVTILKYARQDELERVNFLEKNQEQFEKRWKTGTVIFAWLWLLFFASLFLLPELWCKFFASFGMCACVLQVLCLKQAWETAHLNWRQYQLAILQRVANEK